jgi:rhomboid protease GluP
VLVGVNDDICYNCGRRNPGLWGFAPALRALGNDLGFLPLTVGACVVVYGLTLLSSESILGGGLFSFLAPDGFELARFGASGALTAYELGRWWTVLSAGWLHGNLLHIFFNMYSLRQILPGVAEIYGPARTIIIYTVGSVAGFTLSTMAGVYELPGSNPRGITVGASAAISALIGALWHYGRRSGSSMARSYATTAVIYLIIIGIMMSGIIDNYAHAGGVAGGYLISMVLDPLKRERVDHMVIALACLVASLGSILMSLFTPLPL